MNKKYLVLLIIAISNGVSLQAAVTKIPAINTVATVEKSLDSNRCRIILDGVVHYFDLPGVPLEVVNHLKRSPKKDVTINNTQKEAEDSIQIMQFTYRAYQASLSSSQKRTR